MRILKPPYGLCDFDAIDPGVEYWAWARFVGGCLVKVGMDCHDPSPRFRLECTPLTVVIEMPQTYRNGKARSKDVDNLIFSAGAIAARYQDVVQYTPNEWKGQVEKEIHQPRILKALECSERKILAGLKKKDLKHILDAVGLGLFHLDRLGR